MDRKHIDPAHLNLKLEGPDGHFIATFSTFSVIDKDGDVTLPGSFDDGAETRVSAFGHSWDRLPIGKGTIHQDDSHAWLDGQLFLDTQEGLDTYKAIKNLGGLTEFSYGFDINDQSFGEFEGQQVRFLRSMVVHEVSPVMVGAGVNTVLNEIKSASGDLTAAERNTLETMLKRNEDSAIHLRALLGTASEELKDGKADGQPPAEDHSEVKEAPTIRAGILTVQLGAELLELGAE